LGVAVLSSHGEVKAEEVGVGYVNVASLTAAKSVDTSIEGLVGANTDCNAGVLAVYSHCKEKFNLSLHKLITTHAEYLSRFEMNFCDLNIIINIIITMYTIITGSSLVTVDVRAGLVGQSVVLNLVHTHRQILRIGS